MVVSSCQSVLLIPGSPPEYGCGLRRSSAIDPVPQVACESSIGRVAFLTHRKEQAEAILDVHGNWRCPTLPVLDRVLNALHQPRRDSASDLPFGHAELIRVAAWLKGAACFARALPDDDGRGRRASTSAPVTGS